MRNYLLCLLLFLISCVPSKEKQALTRLQLARTVYEQGDIQGALAHIDTIKRSYREAIKEVLLAEEFKKEINAKVLLERQNELDSVNTFIAGLEGKFISQKTEFDRYTRYIHKRQNHDTRWNKSYLQIHLNEIGDLSLSSNYYGAEWLNHTNIRVYDGDKQARTGTVALDDILNHRSDFLNTKWEKITYMNETEGGVIDFIATNANLKLKAAFLGKKQYYIVLEDFDKQAVVDAVTFSIALKKKRQLESDIKVLQK